MRKNTAVLKAASVVVMLGVAACATANAQLRAAAEKPKRGFWYKGFQPIENPFQKPGTQYWVSPDGDDNNDGTKDKPWKTLSHARESIKGGDIVNILPGLYYFDGNFGPAGPSEDKKTLWRAVDQTFKTGRVVITRDEEMVPPSWSNADNVSIQGLWLGGDFKFAFTDKGGGSYTSRNSEVINCTFFNGTGFAGGPAYNWLFQNGRIVHGGQGHFGHSMYMAGGARHDLPWNSRNLRVLGNIVIGGEGYAFHCWHSPVSATLAGNFSSGNYYSVVLQGPNHSCHHNVFWKARGRVSSGDAGQLLNAWLPSRLRRFDHIVFGTPAPVIDTVVSLSPIKKIYLLYDTKIGGVPDEEHILLNGKRWTGSVPYSGTIGQAKKVKYPGPTKIRPDFFPRTDEEIDAAVAAITRYFREHNPKQIAQDKSDKLEKLFDVLEVQYTTTVDDYAAYPPMSQEKDDPSYGAH